MRLFPKYNGSISVLCNEHGGELCSRCVGINETFNCGWCHSQSLCSTSEQCDTGGFLPHGSVCPYESILGIFVVLSVLFVFILIAILVVFIVCLLDRIALLIRRRFSPRESKELNAPRKSKEERSSFENRMRKKLHRLSQISCDITWSSNKHYSSSTIACETSLIPSAEGQFYVVLQIKYPPKDPPIERKESEEAITVLD